MREGPRLMRWVVARVKDHRMAQPRCGWSEDVYEQGIDDCLKVTAILTKASFFKLEPRAVEFTADVTPREIIARYSEHGATQMPSEE